MFEELSDILRNRVSPEIESGMASLSMVLERHHAVMFKDRIIQLRMDANNHESITITDEAIGIVYGQINALLQQMHLSLAVDSVNMEKLAQILEALLFEPSDDDATIATIIGNGDGGTDVLCDILSLRLGVAPEELIDVIVAVPPECIEVISERIEKNLSYGIEAMDGVQQIVQLVSKHQGLVGDSTTLGMESLNEGPVTGIDPQIVLEQNRERLLKLEPHELVDQIISICLLAGVQTSRLVADAMEYVEVILHDPFAIQKAYKHAIVRVSKLKGEAQ